MSQIVAQGTKIKAWEIVVTKVSILSFVMPNIKHIPLFVDFILTLEWGPVNESVFLLAGGFHLSQPLSIWAGS